MEEEIELEVKALETCAYSNATFREILTRIQKAVDNLSLHAYSNLPQWVAKLDQRVGYCLWCYSVYALCIQSPCLLHPATVGGQARPKGRLLSLMLLCVSVFSIMDSLSQAAKLDQRVGDCLLMLFCVSMLSVFSLHAYSNLHQWVAKLDQRVGYCIWCYSVYTLCIQSTCLLQPTTVGGQARSKGRLLSLLLVCACSLYSVSMPTPTCHSGWPS